MKQTAKKRNNTKKLALSPVYYSAKFDKSEVDESLMFFCRTVLPFT